MQLVSVLEVDELGAVEEQAVDVVAGFRGGFGEVENVVLALEL